MNFLYIPTFNKETDIDKHIKKYKNKYLTNKNPEFIVVSGGDGSLLHAIQDYSYLNIPFYGISAGTKNFLMNKTSIKDLDNKNFLTSIVNIEAYSLKIKVERYRSNGSKKVVFNSIAMNDIVFGGNIMDFNSFEIKNFKQNTISFKGMGLIFSTSIGSTAFYYNNNGEIIKDIEKPIIGISSIVSERENSFYEHLELNGSIFVKIKSTRNKCSLFVDGQTKIFDLKENDIIEISLGKKIKLLFKDIENFKSKRNELT